MDCLDVMVYRVSSVSCTLFSEDELVYSYSESLLVDSVFMAGPVAAD